MRSLAPLDAIAFAELLDLCRVQEAGGPSPANGSFLKQRRAARDYWYYRGYERSANGEPGRASLVYAGVVGDPEVEARVAAHASRKAAFRMRRDLSSRLRRAGLPAPLPVEGAIIKALAEARLFASGSTLVGTAAFQTYSGLLGLKLQSYRTQDIDIAQPSSLRLGGTSAPSSLLANLQAIDASFAPYFHAISPKLAAGFRNTANFGVELLTPLRGRSTEPLAQVAGVPGLGAQRLRFLDYLIAEPVPSLVLHGEGVAVMVPQPMRYAVHKMMLAALRGSASGAAASPKVAKDLAQAGLLVQAAAVARAEIELGTAWLDAWGRGPTWRKLLREGTLKLASPSLRALAVAVGEAALLYGRTDPFAGQDDSRRSLLVPT